MYPRATLRNTSVPFIRQTTKSWTLLHEMGDLEEEVMGNIDANKLEDFSWDTTEDVWLRNDNEGISVYQNRTGKDESMKHGKEYR